MKEVLLLKRSFWMTTPFLTGLIFILFNQIPLPLIPHYHQSFPFFVGGIFYFSIFNPKALNVFWVFLLGLFADIISSVPLGFNAFGYVFLFFITNLFRSYLINTVFIRLWIVFCILFFCVDVIWAFLFFLVSDIWVSSGFWFVQYLFVCLSYPIFCRLYGFLNRKILEVR